MAQSAVTTASTSRLNRRFLFLALILAALSAVLVYAAISRSGKSSGGGGDVPVVVAKSTIPPGTRITGDMVEVRQLPGSVVGFQALSTLDSVVGQVTRYPVVEGEQLLASKIVDATTASNDALSYILEPGKRGMAIIFDDLVGADGLVLPGDHVDLVWVPFKGAPAFILLSDIEVSAVATTVVNIAPSAPGLLKAGVTPVPNSDRTRVSDASPQPDAKSTTLLLTPEQTTTVLCAENNARKFEGELRMAVRSFGDTAPLTPNAPSCPPIDLALQFGRGN
jgi:Flp pilus assembly protein CpaB